MVEVKRLDSSDTDVAKFVFDFGDAVAESVLYKYGDYKTRTVMCISTQSGCPVGCRFCGAGDNFVRSLTEPEITYQVAHMLDAAGMSLDNPDIDNWQIMFMSMGEPMLNYKNLKKSIQYFDQFYPTAKLLISTSGPRVDHYDDLIQLSKEIPNIGLQFSVHESTDAKRNELIPFANKLTMLEMRTQGKTWAQETGRKAFFNYCAHENNTDYLDAYRLSQYFNPDFWEATISVVCERDESIAEANARQRQLALDFMAKLDDLGFSTRCFDPAGQDDIGGGCGQLFHVQEWMKKNPEKINKSCGHGKPVVHSPS